MQGLFVLRKLQFWAGFGGTLLASAATIIITGLVKRK